MKILSAVEKKQCNFWNHCTFGPTDAVEDPWGKRILDQMSKDGAVKTIRIYTMFEDIVYLDENNELQYDFRLSDLRLDYLLERGYDLLLTYAGMPDCIADNEFEKSSVTKNKTRYKGKMWNTSPPKDIKLWEEICYEYTKHNVERYGIEQVSKWCTQCFNEPDHRLFFMRGYPNEVDADIKVRCAGYCAMYKAFVRGVRRVSSRILVGGPVLAGNVVFLGYFLDFVREQNIDLDFISLHNYGTTPRALNEGTGKYCVQNQINRHEKYLNVVKEHGYADRPIVIDEWGMSSAGFNNREECPALMARETEIMSAYYVKLIDACIRAGYNVDKLMICLSGQHEMTEDFSGFRNFFTLNFIKKPIYNAHVLASKLFDKLLKVECGNGDIAVIPTKNENGEYAVLFSYASEYFEEDIPEIMESISFEEDIKDKVVRVWKIDKETTNPYRLYQKWGVEALTLEQLKLLREEGKLKPVLVQTGKEKLDLLLSANGAYLITVTKE